MSDDKEPSFPPTSTDGAEFDRRLETLAAVLLSVATLAVAWAGYQSTRWHSEQAIAQAKATASRIEATKTAGIASREGQVDVALFTQWVDAQNSGDTKLAAFYRRAFTGRFRPAFTEWLAMKPFTNADAPASPFELDSYRLAALGQTERLETTAAKASTQAIADINRADRYLLTVVFFASCLFFAGISTRLRSPAARSAILALGWIMFVAAAVWMVSFPVSVTL